MTDFPTQKQTPRDDICHRALVLRVHLVSGKLRLAASCRVRNRHSAVRDFMRACRPMDVGIGYMTDIIARLEAAPEGNRELDLEISKMEGVCPPNAFLHSDGSGWWANGSDWGNHPAYTTSLDAAINLIPEGCGWKVQRNLNGNVWAVVQLDGAGPPDYWKIWAESDNCLTPALAICIAALKARQSDD